MQGNFYGWVHITANWFYFNLNVLKFELQYEWAPPPQIFFCGYRVLQPFCNNVDRGHGIKCSQKIVGIEIFLISESDLVLILTHGATGGVQQKNALKMFAILTEKHLCQNLFLSCNFIKRETLAQKFSCEFFKIFKNTFFIENLWMTPSILQQLLALYFAVIYRWQLSSSEKSLLEEKKSSIHVKDFTDLHFFCTYNFFHFLWQMSVYLVSYAKRKLYSEQPIVLLARRHLNTMLLTNFQSLNFISNISQETNNFF